MKKLIKSLTVFAGVLTAGAFVACGDKQHEHTFADSWITNSEYHWHGATCEHSEEVFGKEQHDYVDGVCMVCGYTNSSQEEGPSNDPSGEDGEISQGLFTFQTLGEEGYVVTGVTDSSVETLDIPSTYNGLPVLQIGDRAFRELPNVTTVVIPETIEYIGAFPFYFCEKIETIYYNAKNSADAVGMGENNQFTAVGSEKGIRLIIGATVERIPENLFSGYGMQYLKWVEFAENSTCVEIGSGAFHESTIEELTLPKSLQRIGGWAFAFCENLKKFSFTGTVGEWLNISFEDKDSSPLHYADEVYVNGELFTEADIPSTVTSIPESAFENCLTLESVRIPESVTKIGNKAFVNCPNLTNVYYDAVSIEAPSYADDIFINEGIAKGFTLTIGLTVREIPARTFYGSSVRELVFEGDNGTRCQVIGSEAFFGCGLLEKVEIEKGVKEVGDSAFAYCPNIKEIVFNANIADSVETPTPFENASNVIGCLTIGEAVEKIPARFFYGCKNITSLVFVGERKVIIGKQAFMSCSRLQTATFNDCIKEFGEESFRECVLLQEVTIGKSVDKIGLCAFNDCVSIAKVTYLSEVCTGENASGAFSIQEGKEAVTFDLTIGDGVKEIPQYCFSDSRVKAIVFAANSRCKKIAKGAFAYCRKLESCELPNSVTEIGEWAFYHTACTSFTIPDGVARLEEQTFGYNTNLTSVTLGSGLVSIDRFAFASCDNLASVNFKNKFTWYSTFDVEQWNNQTGGTEMDVTDPSVVAKIFCDNSGYKPYWYRK